MKTKSEKLSTIVPTLFPFFIMTRNNKLIIYLFSLFIITCLSGCFRTFYNPNTKSSVDTATLSRLIAKKRFFIIHFSNSVNGLENVYTRNDSLFGKTISLPPEHAGYLRPDSGDTSIRVKSADKQNTINEVHLYTTRELRNTDSMFAENIASFNRVDVYALNKKATRENHIMSVVGLTLATAFLLLLTLLAAYGGGYY